ncbi:stalk domain-containing protein [Paenibacillus filicis]|uniref:Stalk domain-containing protein n=1 Tax=Paenibacillus filicis TaxID=669464 RepID=A0ABU9DQI7_9BACL
MKLELIPLFQSKWKYSALSLLFALAVGGNTAYAEKDFFWSEAVPLPSCSSNTNGTSNMGVVRDGKKIVLELPTCEEARKNQVLVMVNGQYLQVHFGVEGWPFIENGRTMVPLRALADAFAFEVDWEASEQKITLTREGKSIVMQIGKAEMQVDGKKVQLEEAVPLIKGGVTFLPVRQIAEILGIEVEWDGETRTAKFK